MDGLRASGADRTSNLQKEMSTAHDFTSTIKERWAVYMQETERRYLEDTAAVESGRSCLEDGLQDWYGLNANPIFFSPSLFLV